MGDYFEAQGIKIIRGRDFTAADREDAPLVVIVNRTLAEHYWPGQDPIGKRLHRGGAEAVLPWLTVVGEIGEVKQLAADLPTAEQLYIPADSNESRFGVVCDTGHGDRQSAVRSCCVVNCRPSKWPTLCARSSAPLIRSFR